MTTHPVDTVVAVPCAGCGEDLALTWTKSAEGHGVLHGRCYEAKEAGQ